MGLTKDIELPSGLKINNAYYRIDTISGNTREISFTLAAYISRAAFLEGKTNMSYESFTFKPSNKDTALNVFRQAYGYLKSIDDYVDAIDVLESGQSALNV